MFVLSVENHDRDIVNLTYVYPVVSRRAGGVSLGINLNPNNKCNWQCVYCQVPNLKRGLAPKTDIICLEQELDSFLYELLKGSYMQDHVPEQCRQLCDLAISGNGEPTTCPNFDEVVALVILLMKKYALSVPLRLITNGSSVHKKHVRSGIEMMGEHGGEVWYKVDAIGEDMTRDINGVSLSSNWQLNQLGTASGLCATWLQTCVLKQQSENDSFAEHYLEWLKEVLASGIKLKGVLLYGLARPSLQEGGDKLESADKQWMQCFAQKIESLGLAVKVS